MIARVLRRTLPTGTVPNAVTLSGHLSAVAWLLGGSSGFALYSLLADEIDGPLARLLGETTPYGRTLDYSVDVALAGAVAMRLDAPWLLSAIPVQAALHTDGVSIPFGSLRAALMSYALMTRR